MTIQTQDNSIRYHLYMVGLLSSRRIITAAFKHRELLIGFSIGVAITLIAFALNSPAFQQMGYTQTLTYTEQPPVILPNTDTEIIDTELASSFGGTEATAPLTYNFTGRFIATNEPVNTFECSFNNDPYKGCTSPFTISDLATGNYTFEVRSVLSNGTVDPTPAASFWNIQ